VREQRRFVIESGAAGWLVFLGLGVNRPGMDGTGR